MRDTDKTLFARFTFQAALGEAITDWFCCFESWRDRERQDMSKDRK